METLGTYVANVVLIIVMLKTCIINTSMSIKWNILFICRSLHANFHIVLKKSHDFFEWRLYQKKSNEFGKIAFEKNKHCKVE